MELKKKYWQYLGEPEVDNSQLKFVIAIAFNRPRYYLGEKDYEMFYFLGQRKNNKDGEPVIKFIDERVPDMDATVERFFFIRVVSIPDAVGSDLQLRKVAAIYAEKVSPQEFTDLVRIASK